MNLNDDIFNRYIDNELRREEREEFERIINSSQELKKKLEAMKLLHGRLRVLREESPSLDFTVNVMNRISRAAAFRKSQNYFIISVISLFSLLCLAAAGYFLYGTFSNISESSYSLPDITGTLSVYINSFTERAYSLISPKYFSLIGYFAASIIVLAGYIFFENFRSLRKFK